VRTVIAVFFIATALQAQTDVGRYHLQSNPWVNLHQRLLYEAQFDDAPLTSLAPNDLAAWKAAVEEYRKFVRKKQPINSKELMDIDAALAGTRGWELADSVPAAAATVLKSTMPLYRRTQWEDDDRVNRFWIAVAQPLLACAAEELAAAHAKVYGVAFPKRILVDVSAAAWRFGAYTVGEGDFAHAIIASTNPDTQGFGALESLMHEPSHAIVDARSGAIGPDLVHASQELNLRPMANLWHAILFYTSGELTRSWLARHGVTNYRPFILNMYSGPFRGFQNALETHWQGYLDGKVTREVAIRQILTETAAAPPKKP
jgi:hypothetical protein